MATLHKKDVVAAERRGEVDRGTAERLQPTAHRRICPACGESFRPFSVGHKGFCCGCCAFEWNKATENQPASRILAKGIEVVVYETGLFGTIRSVLPDLTLLVNVDGEEEPLHCTAKDVERIQYLVVAHSC